MFINVQFGYNQSKVFNINCQVAPLLDAIATQSYKEMGKAIKQREAWFEKEISKMQKNAANLEKRLAQIDKDKQKEERRLEQEALNSSRAELEKAKKTAGGKGKKKMTKKEQEAEVERLRKEEEERKAREEEEARLKAEEEERLRQEEEAKKAKEKKGGKGKGKGKEEEAEEQVEETEEQKIEKEKAELNAQLEEIKATVKAYEEKVKLCQEQAVKVAAEAEQEKVIELSERGPGGDRKFMKNSLDEMATELLRERKAYVLGQVKKNEQDEEVVEHIAIDGACMRTPDEDIKWAEEQAELEAQAAKGGKGKAAPGKKK